MNQNKELNCTYTRKIPIHTRFYNILKKPNMCDTSIFSIQLQYNSTHSLGTH